MKTGAPMGKNPLLTKEMKLSVYRSGIHYSSRISFEEVPSTENLWFSISTFPGFYFYNGHFFLELFLTTQIDSYEKWSIRSYKSRMQDRSKAWHQKRSFWIEFFDQLKAHEITAVSLIYKRKPSGAAVMEASWGPRNRIDRKRDGLFETLLHDLVINLAR